MQRLLKERKFQTKQTSEHTAKPGMPEASQGDDKGERGEIWSLREI